MTDRIVHLCYAGTSGASASAIRIARGSTRPGRHAYVLYGVCEVRPDYARDLDAIGCEWRYVPKRPGADWMGYRAAASAMCALGPAAAVLHGARTLPVGLWLRAMRRRLPLVAVHRGPLTDLRSLRGRLVCTAFSALGSVVVANSHAMERALVGGRLWPVGVRRPRVILNALDADFWRGEPSSPEPGRPLRIGMVAALEDTKDHATLLKAVALLARRGRNVTLDLAGSGANEASLRRLARVEGVSGRVSFLGTLSREQVRDALRRWNVVVHATFGETLGMAVMEAMMSARAVVASDAPGVGDLIRDGDTGLLAAPGDAEAMADAIARLADDPALAQRLAPAARRHVETNFNLGRMSGEYERLVDELLHRRRRR